MSVKKRILFIASDERCGVHDSAGIFSRRYPVVSSRFPRDFSSVPGPLFSSSRDDSASPLILYPLPSRGPWSFILFLQGWLGPSFSSQELGPLFSSSKPLRRSDPFSILGVSLTPPAFDGTALRRTMLFLKKGSRTKYTGLLSPGGNSCVSRSALSTSRIDPFFIRDPLPNSFG
jgi:hypothetical protein